MVTVTKVMLLGVPLLCGIISLMLMMERQSTLHPGAQQVQHVSTPMQQQDMTQSQTQSQTQTQQQPAINHLAPHAPLAPGSDDRVPLDATGPPYEETQRRHPFVVSGIPALPDSDPGPHCPLAKGSWCGPYWTQPRVPARPVPRGDKECPANCNGVGTCNHDTGKCACRAGWDGDDCTTPRKRPCFNMGPDKRDLNYTDGEWLHTRCAGICDDDIGMCYCPPDTPMGRQTDPAAPPGARPIKQGRPLYYCAPNTTKDGTPVRWAWLGTTYEQVYGPNGWCMAEEPARKADGGQACECHIDGLSGPNCMHVTETVCMNQCGGHGECFLGFCKCHPGWYGHDCSRKKAGKDMEKGDHHTTKPWLKSVVQRVPAADAEPDYPKRTTRKRPFIYVYDLPPRFNSHMLAYRIDRHHCTYRVWSSHNTSEWVGYNAYSIETVFHELMLTSEHRTFDPEEADYFYMPVHVACLADVIGKADKPIFPDDVPGRGMWHFRVQHMSMMLLEAQRWVAQNLPYWNRTGGTDHIWMLAHDEGPCYVHQDMWNSVIISHWGRMDLPHGSNSSYPADDYSREWEHHSLPNKWLNVTSKAHACHDPEKHLVVPVYKPPTHYKESVYLGGPTRTRDILAFFRGDMGLNRPGCTYSRCIRQKIWKMYKGEDWKAKHNIWYGGYEETQGEYTALLSRSKFCLVIPGDGWSARYEDAATHGCVPVIIMDNTLGPFEALIDYSQFSIRVGEHELHKLVDILLAVTPERLAQLQAGLARAWMRFRWNGAVFGEKTVYQIMAHHRAVGHTDQTVRPGMVWAPTSDDDAFSTMIQWLYHRIPATRGKAVG